MGKSSSSSLKKKRSKVSSSQARNKKRSKSGTRRKNKSKKLRHRDDSISYSGDSDYSGNSLSVLFSSSENDYRSRRSRSRTRKDVKSSKRRARRKSSSSERTEDTPRVKKRKGSKKSGDFQVRKKTHEKKKNKKKKKKKKSKREVSVSSTSSGSWSCSTCQGGSGSSDESEVEKNRGRSERRDKDRRRVEKVKSGSKRRRSRSRSCSSCSRYSDYRSDEQLTGEVNVRRLRSVITVVRQGNEQRGMDEDEHKEEMVSDYDDYPPSRSNDSNDGGSKREFVHNSHVTSEKKRHAEDEKGEVVVSNIRSGKVAETDKDSEDYDGNSPYDGFKMNGVVKEKRNDDSGVVDSPNAYNLESILRQKALENLRSFRRGHQKDAKAPVNQKDLIHSDVKRLSTTKAELFQNKSSKGGGARAVSTSQVVGDDSIPAASEGPAEISNLSDGNNGCKDNGAKQDVAHPPDWVAVASSPNKVNKTFGSESYKPRFISLASRRETSNASIKKKQEPALQQEPLQAKSMTGNSVDLSKVETAQTVIHKLGKTNCEEVNNAHSFASDDTSSCPKSISGGISSNKPQDEAKDDSQFEQKTMTVMRGGELVEVSYKVYIPKKAPALSRRSLNR